jgi:hypothetical protein
MHAIQVLQKIVSPVTASLDRRNARTVLLAVAALLAGRRLTLMELARHFPGAERVRAPLKRLDRLLSNAAVQAERAQFYSAAARWLVRSRRPVRVVDWSELTRDGRWHVLRAGVAAKGRTLTVYEEVHPESRKHSPRVEKAFLRRLQAVLPHGVDPIVVTDAGFGCRGFGRCRRWDGIGSGACAIAPTCGVSIPRTPPEAGSRARACTPRPRSRPMASVRRCSRAAIRCAVA